MRSTVEMLLAGKDALTDEERATLRGEPWKLTREEHRLLKAERDRLRSADPDAFIGVSTLEVPGELPEAAP